MLKAKGPWGSEHGEAGNGAWGFSTWSSKDQHELHLCCRFARQDREPTWILLKGASLAFSTVLHHAILSLPRLCSKVYR